MNVFPIRNDEDHDRALACISEIMDAKLGSPEGEELEILLTLVDAYESKHHAIEAPDPIAAINFPTCYIIPVISTLWKVESGGSGHTTRVFYKDVELTNVVGVQINISPESMVDMTIDVVGVDLDVQRDIQLKELFPRLST